MFAYFILTPSLCSTSSHHLRWMCKTEVQNYENNVVSFLYILSLSLCLCLSHSLSLPPSTPFSFCFLPDVRA